MTTDTDSYWDGLREAEDLKKENQVMSLTAEGEDLIILAEALDSIHEAIATYKELLGLTS